ncbi:MAG: helix-turn-helix transcriptional regulator [Lachnospiraceae bacterium]|nr:helix-turn-helix transcriptional regulator [Lachnospiraceae bacterium]
MRYDRNKRVCRKERSGISFYDENAVYEPVFYYAMHLEHFEMEPHRHKGAEIMLVSRGTCEIWAEERKWRLKAGEFIFLDEGVVHCLRVGRPDECTLLNLEIGKDALPEQGVSARFLSEADEEFAAFFRERVPYYVGKASPSLGLAMQDYIELLMKKEEKKSLLPVLLFERVLIELARSRKLGSENAGMQYVRKAMAYILENYCEDIDQDMIAGQVELHPSYLQELFAGVYGCGLMAYVKRLRLERAKFLLVNTELPVVEVAAESGFNSRQHFSGSFAKACGMSPQKYRKQYGRNEEANTGRMQNIKKKEEL